MALDSDPRVGADRAVPDQPREPVNPYFAALWVAMLGCGVAGFILLSIGNGLASTFAHQAFGTITDTGIGQIVWGGALLGLAVTTAIVMLGAAAARWERP